jgi:hypothetical protein
VELVAHDARGAHLLFRDLDAGRVAPAIELGAHEESSSVQAEAGPSNSEREGRALDAVASLVRATAGELAEQTALPNGTVTITLLGSGATAGHVPVQSPFKVIEQPDTMLATQEGDQT